MTNRTAQIDRRGHQPETKIQIDLGIDGKGTSRIETKIPFFDHMLTLFARHSLCDLTIKADGDIEVDLHHTVEDTGIALGSRPSPKALGEKRGIRRYGWAYLRLMDETLARVVIDFQRTSVSCTTARRRAWPRWAAFRLRCSRSFAGLQQHPRRHQSARRDSLRARRPSYVRSRFQGPGQGRGPGLPARSARRRHPEYERHVVSFAGVGILLSVSFGRMTAFTHACPHRLRLRQYPQCHQRTAAGAGRCRTDQRSRRGSRRRMASSCPGVGAFGDCVSAGCRRAVCGSRSPNGSPPANPSSAFASVTRCSSTKDEESPTACAGLVSIAGKVKRFTTAGLEKSRRSVGTNSILRPHPLWREAARAAPRLFCALMLSRAAGGRPSVTSVLDLRRNLRGQCGAPAGGRRAVSSGKEPGGRSGNSAQLHCVRSSAGCAWSRCSQVQAEPRSGLTEPGYNRRSAA